MQLCSRAFWTFKPNLKGYSSKLYPFKVGAFFWDTVYTSASRQTRTLYFQSACLTPGLSTAPQRVELLPMQTSALHTLFYLLRYLLIDYKKPPRSTQPSVPLQLWGWWIEYQPAWLGLRRSTFTCVGWQVCDPIRQVTLRSSGIGFPWRATRTHRLLERYGLYEKCQSARITDSFWASDYVQCKLVL